MSVRIRDPVICTHALQFMCAVAWKNEDVADRLAEGGAVGVILKAMRVYGPSIKGSRELQDAAAPALWSLALCEKGLAVMLGSSDEAQESVTQATLLHPCAVSCQRFGRLLLQVLCE